MKYIITILLLIFNINNIHSQIVMDSYVFENGIVENRSYTCNKFDWKISFPEGTTIMSLDRIHELEEKGYKSITDEIPEGMRVNKHRPHLIGFSYGKYNYFTSSLEPLTGIKRMTLKEHQEFISKLLTDTYSKIEILKAVQDVSFEKIGEHDFYAIKTKLFDKRNNNLLLTQILYNSYIKNNLFSASINYNDEEKGKILVDNFINSLSKP